MKKLAVSLLLLSLVSPLVHAEISPVIVHLQSTSQGPVLTFNVPEGKILVVEHVWGTNVTAISITIQSTKFTVPTQTGTLATSMKLGSGWRLQAPVSINPPDIFLLGYLADPKDLSGNAPASSILSGIELR